MESPEASVEAEGQAGHVRAGPSFPSPQFSTLSLPTRVAAAVVGGLLALLAVVHMVMVTFWVAPPENPVSQQYGSQMRDYLGSEFAQSWSLFAPHTSTSSYHLEVRVELRGGNGAETSGWIDLTARDEAALRHSLVPSKSVTYQLRRAVSFYLQSHDREGNPSTASAPVVESYLRRLVMDRLTDDVDVHRVERAQFRLANYRAEPPSWMEGGGPYAPRYQEHHWWRVQPADLPGSGGQEEAAS